MKIKNTKAILSLLLMLSFLVCQASVSHQAAVTSLNLYIKQLSEHNQFKTGYLEQLFKQTHYNPHIIAIMNHPFEKHPWYQYREIFLDRPRIQNGSQFWIRNQKILNAAEKKYGVPASIIVAILGVETRYGKRTGNYPVIDSLTTLAFHYPKRAAFFQKELTEYLLLTREQKLSPLGLTGSYAGAIGISQFMPSAYRRYAVDYSHQGSANLVNNTADAIFSVANYLNKMGWRRGKPVSERLEQQKIDKFLISTTAEPEHRIAYFSKRGVSIKHTGDKFAKVSIIALPTRSINQSEYWLTFENFRSIMRYNPRINYAMAVFQLSEAIKNDYRQKQTAASTKSSPTRETEGST